MESRSGPSPRSYPDGGRPHHQSARRSPVQRLTVGAFFQCEFLLDAVIGKDEIIGSETEDRLAATGLYPRRTRTRSEPRRRTGVGWNILCMRAAAART